MKVMVVDDEADMRTLFEQRFRREVRAGQITFYFAQSGAEALTLLEQVVGEVTLILSDINMPGMTGLDLLKVVKAKHQHLKVYLVTAYDNAEYEQRAVEYGCDEYFTKPLDFGLLKAKLVAGEAA